MNRSPLARRVLVASVTVAVAALGVGAAGSTSPAGAVRPVVDPLTGTLVAKTGPVVAVKVANTPQARPQSGLRSADQIWVEEQEGGWTRFIAIYGSAYPAKVGPVRSGRETDLGVLPQFGKAGLAFAGADADVENLIATSPRVVNVGKNAIINNVPVRSSSYYTVGKNVPYNFFAQAARLRSFTTAGGGTKARAMGFTFGRPRAAGKPGKSLAIRWSRNSAMSAVYSKSLGMYVMYADGKVLKDRESGKPLTARNIVVMRVAYSLSKINNSLYPVPVLKTVGKSSAIVLRQGQRWAGTWTRTSLSGGTFLRDTAGRTMTLAPGQTWVFLVPIGRSLNKPYVLHSVTVR